MVELLETNKWAEKERLELDTAYEITETGENHCRFKGGMYQYDFSNIKHAQVKEPKNLPPAFNPKGLKPSHSMKSKCAEIREGNIPSTGTAMTYAQLDLAHINTFDTVELKALVKECKSRIKKESKTTLHHQFLKYILEVIEFYRPSNSQPKFDWDNLEEHPKWIRECIEEAEKGYLPSVPYLIDLNERLDHEFISMGNFVIPHLFDIKEQALVILNERDTTNWFRDYCHYLHHIISWHLEK